MPLVRLEHYFIGVGACHPPQKNSLYMTVCCASHISLSREREGVFLVSFWLRLDLLVSSRQSMSMFKI